MFREKVFSRLDYFLAFGLGSGLSPKAPGTVGSLVGLLLFLPVLCLPIYVQLAVVVGGFVFGCWLCDRVAEDMSVKDPGGIVWDEFVGMWIVMLWLPSLYWLIPAFLLFRLFDIWKPWPVSVADRSMTGGLGIMVDDVIAGVYALGILQAIPWILRQDLPPL
ncbi:MAG: phosphatidylglycerophosphatase A [Pseudomonadales bacterium]|nr:phosphatidylglycerophosphatase A [Pseudomonadales bacterium]MBO6658045.1 phosphatidylglycerophosphatase A [Pseudomonadales bacterium]MBO6703090.1 phosphatidylglycerophosphatase A [Pseudomonadales bacterium]MBO7007940.1 phosphatidylglycerophosphatase A [Pseudomonadales bacterium]